MPKPIPLPTQQELHEIFDYSLITGKLYWKKKVSRKVVVGKEAGSKTAGYIAVPVRKTKYLAHRLIWVWVTGEDPGALDIDHKNEIKDCNAWHNLRKATRSQNFMNKRKSKGYFKNRYNTYTAVVQVEGVQHRLGNFRTEAEAAEAVKKASLELHGEFSRYYENQTMPKLCS